MDKYLFILSILCILLISGCINNVNQENENVQCFNQTCNKYDKPYCLDCNLSCKPEFCNSNVVVIYKNYSEEQKKSLSEIFRKLNQVYTCLNNFYGYAPSLPIYFVVGKTGYSCWGECIPYMGKDNEIIISDNVIVHAFSHDVHEIAHVFTNYGLKETPIWFNEGISIYTESMVYCISDYPLQIDKFNSFIDSYNQVKNGKKTLEEVAPYDEYYKVEHDAHAVGAMYFGALEQDYNCDKKCVGKILYSLHNQTESITNKLIKQKSGGIVRQNLTSLFDLLEIKY